MSLSQPNHDLERGFFRAERDSTTSLRELLEAQSDILGDILRHLEDQNVTNLSPELLDSNPPSPCDSGSTLADTAIGPRNKPNEAPAGTRHDYRSIATQTGAEVTNHPPLAHRSIPTPPPSPPTTPARSISKSRKGESTQVHSSIDSNSKVPLGPLRAGNVAVAKVGGNVPDPRSLKEPQVIRRNDKIMVPWRGYYIVVRLPPPSKRETTIETTATKQTGAEIMARKTTAVERVATTERDVVAAARLRRLRSCGPISTDWEFKPSNLPSSPIFPPIFFDTIKFEFRSRRKVIL